MYRTAQVKQTLKVYVNLSDVFHIVSFLIRARCLSKPSFSATTSSLPLLKHTHIHALDEEPSRSARRPDMSCWRKRGPRCIRDVGRLPNGRLYLFKNGTTVTKSKPRAKGVVPIGNHCISRYRQVLQDATKVKTRAAQRQSSSSLWVPSK